MIRYYRLDVKKFLTTKTNDEKINKIKEDAFSFLSEKERAMIEWQLFYNPATRQEKTRELTEKYNIKSKRMYEIYETARDTIREYLEGEYSIYDLNEWFTFDFWTFFDKQSARRLETARLDNERAAILELESPKNNMGIRGSGTGDTVGQKVARLEALDSIRRQNDICEAVCREIKKTSTEFEREIMDVVFFSKKTKGYKMDILAEKYNTNRQQLYQKRRKLLEELDEWIKINYLYREDISKINFAMSRRWNLLNR